MFWATSASPDITIVPEQKNPDGNFPTCPYPNPEIFEHCAWVWSWPRVRR